jgi:hypothetical protein
MYDVLVGKGVILAVGDAGDTAGDFQGRVVSIFAKAPLLP